MKQPKNWKPAFTGSTITTTLEIKVTAQDMIDDQKKVRKYKTKKNPFRNLINRDDAVR